MRTRRVLLAFVVLLAVIVFTQTRASALAGGIDGCFFRDLNGSGSQGDELNPGASGESAFTQPISVTLVDTGSAATTTVATDLVTGCFEFPALSDGVDYRLDISYPSEYYSSPTGGDTDVVPGPPPTLAGDPFTASYTFSYADGDDLSITAGVSGLPELSLGHFVTPSGDEMIETGTAPFDTTGNCPTQVPGDDCDTYDNVVRTNDATTIGYTITADNIPDGDVNPLNDVVLEQTITPNTGAVVTVPNLHVSCLTAGVTPPSGIDVDPVTGVITVTCNLGSKDNGTTIVPTYIRAGGEAANGSSFEIAARVYTADDRAQVADDTTMLDPVEIFVSAAPAFDITKGNDSTNPHNRVVYLQTSERTNPVTGEVEYGVNYQWDISVLYDGGAKGQAALVDPITFSDTIPTGFSGWDLVACNNRPYGSTSNMPNDDRPAEDWGDTGTWSCSVDRANNEIDITVTSVDTDGDPIPTEGTNGNSLDAGPYYAFAGSVRIWYPLSDFYRQVDPTWQQGDAPITGDYRLENLITKFDPSDVTGQSNFGDGEEPTDNNDRAVSVPIYERGGFSKHLGSYEWADDQLPAGSTVGATPALWPCSAAAIAAGALMSGQTQACSQGDAPVQPGEKAHFWYWLRNDGTFPWSADSVEVCDAFDNSTMMLTEWTGSGPIFVRTGLPASSIIVEYATAAFGDDVANNDWTNQLAAVRDCTAPNDDWSTDPYGFDADPAASLDKIGMVRIRLDAEVIDEVLPSEYFQVSMAVEVRETFNGGPLDGEPIPVGTILANNANRTFGSTAYSATFMDAETYDDSPWGDRLLLNRHQVRIEKTTSIDPTSPTDDDLFNVQGADTVVWWLQPGITAVTTATVTGVQVVDTLPAGVTFSPLCQARQSYPDTGVVLSSVTENLDGTTTLVFDLGDRETNVAIGAIPVCTKIDNFLEPGTDLVNHVEISSDGDVSPESSRTADRTVSVVAAGQFQLAKTVDAPLELQLDTQTYTIGWTNLSDDFDFAPPDVIDVWPYNGDALNPINQRTEFDSAFTGSYQLTSWMPQPTTILDGGSTATTGGTWYYSADDPATIPYDPDAAVNNLATGTVTWCTQADLTAGTAPCDFGFADSTAVRFVQDDVLISKSSVTVSYTFQAGTIADPNAQADRYVNRFAARTDSVDDLIRSNEVLVQVLSMNLGDLVFLDTDVDGVYSDGTDIPIAGTEVELWRDVGSGTMVFQDSTTTDADGRYLFDDLVEGTYEIRIPDTELGAGGTLADRTQTISPQAADDDENENVDHQATDSGSGYTTSGPIGLWADTTSDPPIGLEPVGENLFSLGNPYTFDSLSNMSIDLGFRGDPEVQVIKEICDAALGSCELTTPPLDPDDGWVETVTVAFTDDASWRISVLNTGDEVLTGITIDDDAEDDCDRAPGTIPDLAVGASYSYLCTTTNVLADILNTATVAAEGIGSGVEVGDDDAAAVETPPADPDIEVIKYVNGDDAQTAPGVYLAPGTAVTFTYEVTVAGGSVPLTDVTVTDDNGTSGDTLDDFAADYVSGDVDDDDRLDLGETWLFEATGFTAVDGQYANWATAEGNPVTAGADPVTDVDPAHYFGVDGSLELTKLVNGDDAQTAPGVLIEDGEPVIFTYQLRNTGNHELQVISLIDDAGTPGDSGDDWTPVFVGGDTDDDNRLDVNEVWRYEHLGEVAVNGPYLNQAAVEATDPLDEELSDTDPANYFGTAPAFSVEKSTNTIDADVDPVLIASGAPVTWTYELSNDGNIAISNPRVSDDNGTPADTVDDEFAAYVSGDTNDDGLLDVDETWLFSLTGTATDPTYRNLATATGTGPETVDESGDPVTGVPLVAEDPSGYTASDPAIAIAKSTNGVDNAVDPGVFIPVGAVVTWSYEVANEGNVPLSDVEVIDDNGTPDDETDDLSPAYVSGDTNDDGLLDLDEVWLYEATGTATAGQYRNSAEAAGTPPDTTDPEGTIESPDPVVDDDHDRYWGAEAAVSIEKAVNGDDADTAPGLAVVIGAPVSWTYTVTNTGNTPLIDVAVTDDQGVVVSCPATVLAVGAEMVCTSVSEPAVAGPYLNVGSVVGTPAEPCDCPEDGGYRPVVDPATGQDVQPVTDDDPANYFGTGAAIEIDKTVCVLDEASGCDPDAPAHWADTAVIAAGAEVRWRIEITNIGNVDLVDAVITDPIAPACDATIPLLEVGQSVVSDCLLAELDGATVNTASVVADPAIGDDPPVRDDDSAETLEPAELELVKAVDQDEILVGETLAYTLVLENTGGTTAVDVEIVDSLPTGLTGIVVTSGSGLTYDASTHLLTWSVDSLPPGATATVGYDAVVSGTGLIRNEVEIITEHDEVDLSGNQSFTETPITDTPSDDPSPSQLPQPVESVLAFTGANSLWLFAIALTLIAGGGFLLLVARRRRTPGDTA